MPDSVLETLAALSAEFPKSEVMQRWGGGGKQLDYIGIIQTIRRFSSVMGASWHWVPSSHTLNVLEGIEDDKGNPLFVATVQGNIVVDIDGYHITRGGVGADKDADPDKALKTADAEALKKAGHKFGVALYLWDEERRDAIAEFRTLAKAPLSVVKKAVVEHVGSTDKVAIAAALGVSEADLDERETLLSFLEKAA